MRNRKPAEQQIGHLTAAEAAVDEQFGQSFRMPARHVRPRAASRRDAYGVLELIARYPVLLRDDIERLTGPEQHQRIVPPGSASEEDRLSEPREGSTIGSATS